MAVPLIPLIAAGASVVGSWINSRSQNKIADKQIDATREENEKARAHNLMLAELQNKWNVEQWAKENEYNSPSAQMARYAAAGLNPNLIYGQSNTSAQLSGSLSSGAPASPADMSAYGRKGSPVGKALENLDPFMYEQLRGMQLQNEEREQNVIKQKFDNAFEQFLQEVDPEANFQQISESSMNLLGTLKGRQAIEAWSRQLKENQELDERIKQAMFNNRLNNASYEYYIKQIAADAQISYENARWLMDTFTLRMMGLKHGTSLLEKQDNWYSYEKAIGVSADVISSLANGYTSLNPPKSIKNNYTNIFNSK